MRRLLGLSLLLSMAGTPLAAQVAKHPRVQQAVTLLGKWLDAERAYQRFPGLSAAVVHDQELVWTGASGYADRERKIPATPGTIYSICSISKLFTSLAVMQLRDQGRIRLDDPVQKHLPWFTIRRSNPESGEITVEGLLTHASGLPREAAFPYWSGPDFEFPTHEQIVGALPAQETLYPAETYFQYSNLGLTLAGEIVAAVSGQPYGEYVRANVLGPLRLSSTSPEMPAAERGKRLAAGYGPWRREGERELLPFFQAKGIAPAAGYASTAEDLGRFASWQFRLLQHQSKEVLDPNTLREMQRVHWVDPDFETTWGLGFVVDRSDGTTFVGHDGACPGYRTSLLTQPDERIAVVVMTNAIDIDALGLSRRGYEIVAPAIKAAVTDSAPTKPADPTLASYLGTYAAAWDGETEVVRWEDGLGLIDFPARNPMQSLTKLRKVGEHAFRRIRKDGKLAEAWTFDVGPDGRATALRVNYNISRRVR